MVCEKTQADFKYSVFSLIGSTRTAEDSSSQMTKETCYAMYI